MMNNTHTETQPFGYMWGNFEEEQQQLTRLAVSMFDGPVAFLTGWADVVMGMLVRAPVCHVETIFPARKGSN